jgi:hypothetical protein
MQRPDLRKAMREGRIHLRLGGGGELLRAGDRFPRLGAPGVSRRAEVGINGGELDPNGGEFDPNGGELGPNGGEPLAEQH